MTSANGQGWCSGGGRKWAHLTGSCRTEISHRARFSDITRPAAAPLLCQPAETKLWGLDTSLLCDGLFPVQPGVPGSTNGRSRVVSWGGLGGTLRLCRCLPPHTNLTRSFHHKFSTTSAAPRQSLPFSTRFSPRGPEQVPVAFSPAPVVARRGDLSRQLWRDDVHPSQVSINLQQRLHSWSCAYTVPTMCAATVDTTSTRDNRRVSAQIIIANLGLTIPGTLPAWSLTGTRLASLLFHYVFLPQKNWIAKKVAPAVGLVGVGTSIMPPWPPRRLRRRYI